MKSLVKRSFGVNLYVMKYVCMYPPEKPTRLFKLGAYIMYLLLTVPVPVLGSLYFFLEEDIPLDRVGDNAFALAQATVCVFKFAPFIINGDQIKKCIHYFESPLPIVFNDKQRNMVKASSNICRRNSRVFFILLICGYTLWSCRPFLLTEYRFPIDLWLPLNPLKKMTFFYSIYLYIVLAIGYIALACAVVDPLIGGLACMAAGQLSVLKDNLQHLHEYSEIEFS
ncbi:7tm 6 domain containing protein, partial [Asbolus verrucosus]